MKKHLSRISVIVSAVFGLVFIILLICTAFGGLSSADFDNKLVKILLFVFGGCYAAITTTAIALQFSEKITVREVQVAQNSGGNIKVTPAVIRGLIRKNVRVLEGVKFRRMSLFLTEFGVQINLTVACSGGRRAQETGAFLQALIADICKRELDLEFRTVNVKVVGFKSVYTPDVAEIEADTQAMLGKQPEFPDEKTDPEYYEVVTPDAETDGDAANSSPDAAPDETEEIGTKALPDAETPASEMPAEARESAEEEAVEAIVTENLSAETDETDDGQAADEGTEASENSEDDPENDDMLF